MIKHSLNNFNDNFIFFIIMKNRYNKLIIIIVLFAKDQL
jgi:hypothetical protein